MGVLQLPTRQASTAILHKTKSPGSELQAAPPGAPEFVAGHLICSAAPQATGGGGASKQHVSNSAAPHTICAFRQRSSLTEQVFTYKGNRLTVSPARVEGWRVMATNTYPK